jgi:hypothetical protein
MTIERRTGNLYYYRSVRESGKVRKVYVGSGELARIAHGHDLVRQAAEQRRRELEQTEAKKLEDLAAVVAPLIEASEVIARAHLIVTGHHRHKREWRRARESA